MQCPHCGSRQIRLIAPNYYECQGSTQVVTGAPPSGAFGPSSVAVTCGRRFAAGGGAGDGSPACSCGQFAIGTCRQCGQAKCGDHARVKADVFQCFECAPTDRQLLRRWKDEAEAREAGSLASLEDRVAEFLKEPSSEPRAVRFGAHSMITGRKGLASIFGQPSPPPMSIHAEGEYLGRTPLAVDKGGKSKYDRTLNSVFDVFVTKAWAFPEPWIYEVPASGYTSGRAEFHSPAYNTSLDVWLRPNGRLLLTTPVILKHHIQGEVVEFQALRAVTNPAGAVNGKTRAGIGDKPLPAMSASYIVSSIASLKNY